MRKRGFTLIELLAVIVILAIIALIAVPIVVSIVDDSKKSSAKESIKLYLDTVEKTIAKRQIENPNFNPTKCNINEKKITCGEQEIEIEIKGELPKSGIIKFGKGMIISGINIELNNLYYQVKNGEVSEGTKEPKYAILLEDTGEQGISRGDKYEYEVSKGIKYAFYVLSIEGTGENQKVNLIMDRNICGYPETDDSRNGHVTDEDNNCLISWSSETEDNSKGPITAMKGLYNATKNWNNVPDMELMYLDEGNNYGEIGVTNRGVYLTEKNVEINTIKENQNPTIPYEEGKPLKARLPKLEEVYKYLSDENYCGQVMGSCPIWLVENLAYYDVTKVVGYDKYAINNNSEINYNIEGYWTLSSHIGSSSTARRVNCNGHSNQSYFISINALYYGLRPVITVSKSDLLD